MSSSAVVIGKNPDKYFSYFSKKTTIVGTHYKNLKIFLNSSWKLILQVLIRSASTS